MSQWIQEQGIQCLNNTDETMEMSALAASEMDMAPYYLYRQKNMSGNFENVGYARDGKYGIYNILIMEEMQSIVALGAGTVSKNVMGGGRIERCDTVKDVDLYIAQIDEMIERKKALYQ
jgi:oxygen-independent coproporphyrinogen-3 oxidase